MVHADGASRLAAAVPLSIALVIRSGSNRQTRVEHNRNYNPRQSVLLGDSIERTA
jgi:hypothetical protein